MSSAEATEAAGSYSPANVYNNQRHPDAYSSQPYQVVSPSSTFGLGRAAQRPQEAAPARSRGRSRPTALMPGKVSLVITSMIVFVF